MPLPHQVGLEITYDGTIKRLNTVSEKKQTSDVQYRIKYGDCLWNLAKKYYGSGAKYPTIYNANKDVLEKAAKAYGKPSSNNGNWIFPGTVITIPNVPASGTTAKKAFVSTGSANTSLGPKIAAQADSFSYTDVASGQSDSVSITLYDIDKEWLGSLMPQRGASLGAKLKLTNWNAEERTDTFDCGTFVLDDISFSGRPLTCTLGGVSVPAADDFKSKERTKTWESTTIREIASEIAVRAKVSLYYSAGTIKISELEQNKQTDSAFLYALCEKYGLAMKVYNNKIVIFDIVSAEKKKSVLTLKETDMLSWDYNTTIEGTYTGVTLEYSDPDSDKPISVTVGSKGRMYSMNVQASSKYDAELQALAKVNAANREIETMTVKLRGTIELIASQCVTITGLGKADGKYYVDKAKHSIGSGYTTQLTLHKVQEAVGEKKAVASGGSKYTIRYGDTLWSLAKKYYGSGAKYTIIYNANQDVLEKAAKAHGKASSNKGNLIFPGTVITIPNA